MKKIILLGIILGFFSCKSQDGIYEEYLVPNGRSYPVPAKNVVAKPGNKRIEIAWQNSADPKVEKARIFWNNYTDSVEMAVNTDMNTVSRIISPMEENTYSFMVRTYDNEGNVSIPVEVMGTVYGENYISSLNNRMLLSTDYDGLNVTLNWFSADESETGVCVNYTDIHGENRNIVVDPSETETLIPDFDTDKPFFYNTTYKPDSLAIDVFHAQVIERRILYYRDITAQKLTNYEMPFKHKDAMIFAAGDGGYYDVDGGWLYNAAGGANGTVYQGGVFNSSLCLEVWPGYPAPNITNGKLYQTVELEAGNYKFTANRLVVAAYGDFNVYVVATSGNDLPDTDAVNSALGVKQIPWENGENLPPVTVEFTLSAKTTVSLGFVATISDAALHISSVQLMKEQ